MDKSDEQLFRRLRRGDSRALEAIYERYEGALFRYAFHMSGSRAVAEEVTHEAFLQLLGPQVRFDPQRGSLEGYLFGAVRNMVRAARRDGDAGEAQEQAFEHDIIGDLIKDEVTAALYEAIRQLPESYRDAVVLCDLEERSYEEAARLMQCPVGTVRSRVHRARALLGSKLKLLTVFSGAAVR